MALEEWIERFKDNIVSISTFAAGVSILACFATSIGLFAQSGHHLVGVYTLFVGLMVLAFEVGVPVLNKMTLDGGSILHTIREKSTFLTPVRRGIIYGIISLGTFINMTAAALAGIMLALTCLLHVAQPTIVDRQRPHIVEYGYHSAPNELIPPPRHVSRCYPPEPPPPYSLTHNTVTV